MTGTPAQGALAGFTRLRTPRLLLRGFAPDAAAPLAAYRSDPDVARYQGWDAPYPLEAAEEFVAGLGRARPGTPGEWYQVAIEERTSGLLVGDLGVRTEVDPRLVRLGFTLAPAAQGHGYATEAVTALLDHLFAHGTHRVSADCDPRNVRSAALLVRVGMRQEAHHVASGWWKGEWTDEDVYAVLARVWSARPNR